MNRAKKDAPPRFPEFREAFLELMGDMTLEQFAKKLGMSRATVGFYAAGQRIPDALGLKKIAEKCNVSADWLLGLSSEPSNDIEIKRVCRYTGLNADAVKWLVGHSAKHPQIDVLNYLLGNGLLLKILSNYYADFVLDLLWAKPYKYIPLKAGSIYNYRHDVHLATAIRVLQEDSEKFKKKYKDSKEFIKQAVYSFLLTHADIKECHRIVEHEFGFGEEFNEEYIEPDKSELDELGRLYDENEMWKMMDESEKEIEERDNAILDFLLEFDRLKK